MIAFHRGYLAVAVVLAAAAFGGTLWLFPERGTSLAALVGLADRKSTRLNSSH